MYIHSKTGGTCTFFSSALTPLCALDVQCVNVCTAVVYSTTSGTEWRTNARCPRVQTALLSHRLSIVKGVKWCYSHHSTTTSSYSIQPFFCTFLYCI